MSKPIEEYFSIELESLTHSLKYAKAKCNKELNELITQIKLTKESGGRIVFTGIGKNVYACQKLAASYSSIGIPAFFMDAVHAVHGDLGVLKPGDLLICQSKSGNTIELINTLRHLNKNKSHFGVKIWGIDCNTTKKENGFDKYCDKTIHLYIHNEIDYLNMVPTVSAIMLQIIGDIVGVSAAEQLGFNSKLFALNHPGGTIGETLN